MIGLGFACEWDLIWPYIGRMESHGYAGELPAMPHLRADTMVVCSYGSVFIAMCGLVHVALCADCASPSLRPAAGSKF